MTKRTSKKASTDALEQLHNLIATKLGSMIENGRKVVVGEEVDVVDVDAATLSAAIRFLKDNGVTAVPATGTPLGDLLNQMQGGEGAAGEHGDEGELSDEQYEQIKQECVGNG
jgi:hypothetical protein